jgi:hypothetical protein
MEVSIWSRTFTEMAARRRGIDELSPPFPAKVVLRHRF